MRLIDADALVENSQVYEVECGDEIGDDVREIKAVLVSRIEKAPTIDPVKHGRWVCHPDPDKMSLVCSVCGQVMPFVPEYLPEEPPYCNCGARMDGEV